MIHEDKPRFIELLSTLFGAHCKPLSEALIQGYWKGLNKMDVDAFERVIDEAIDRLQHSERGVSKIPNVSELWDLKRNMRRLPTIHDRTQEPEWQGDGWDLNANTFLLNYVTQGLVQRSVHGQKPTRDANRYAAPERAAILAKWKNLWAAEMRQDRAKGGKLDGKPLWTEYMACAEDEITRSMQVAA